MGFCFCSNVWHHRANVFGIVLFSLIWSQNALVLCRAGFVVVLHVRQRIVTETDFKLYAKTDLTQANYFYPHILRIPKFSNYKPWRLRQCTRKLRPYNAKKTFKIASRWYLCAKYRTQIQIQKPFTRRELMRSLPFMLLYAPELQIENRRLNSLDFVDTNFGDISGVTLEVLVLIFNVYNSGCIKQAFKIMSYWDPIQYLCLIWYIFSRNGFIIFIFSCDKLFMHQTHGDGFLLEANPPKWQW